MAASRKIFGTDGVRGVANVEPVTPETALKLGRAIAHLTGGPGKAESRRRIVIGRDPRPSGPMLENALVAGITSLGIDVLLAEILPTPAVAFLARTLPAAAGIVISASHNSFEDNGIKFFGPDGYKFPDAIEERLETLTFSGEIDAIRPTGDHLGTATRLADGADRYVAFAKGTFPASGSLEKLRIAVDCAAGAASATTPRILRELGAECHVFHATPSPEEKINDRCGSTFPEEIARLTRESGAQVGLAHDGDADRVLLCDERGEIVDGDEIMAIAAVDLLQSGKLAGRTLVTTVMSNFGLDETLARCGGRTVRTQVGDRYVMEKMREDDLNFGGEQSGHLIFRDHSTTGDGIVSALQILRIMVETGRPLSELKQVLQKFPQAQRNLRVREKIPIVELSTVQPLVAAAERELAGAGRVLLRYSGTEPKIRLLLEGRDAARINLWADQIAAELKKVLGAS